MSNGTFLVRWRTHDGIKLRGAPCNGYQEAAEIAEKLANHWASDRIVRVAIVELPRHDGEKGDPLATYTGVHPPEAGYWINQKPLDEDAFDASREFSEETGENQAINPAGAGSDDVAGDEKSVTNGEDEESTAYATPARSELVVATPPVINREPSHLAATFAADAYQLIQLGVRLDKGATLAEGAGIGAAGLAALQGHWLLAAGAAILGAFASVGAHYYRQKKVDEIREKWRYVLSGLDDASLRQFVRDVRSHYPQIADALAANTLGTYGTQRLLTWGR